jgi:hypothetical protein
MKGFYEDKAPEKLRYITETENAKLQGNYYGVSLSDLSRKESAVACSTDHLVHAIGDINSGTGRDSISLSGVKERNSTSRFCGLAYPEIEMTETDRLSENGMERTTNKISVDKVKHIYVMANSTS